MAQHFDLVILGSGSTAFAAALHAAELGKTVVMTEVRTLGGTCVNRGCLPSKNLIEASRLFYKSTHPRYPGLDPAAMGLDFPALIAQKDEIIHDYRDKKYRSIVSDSNRIKLLSGHAAFVDPNEVLIGDERLTANRFLVATGTTPDILDVPGLSSTPYLTSDLLTSLEDMELKELPESIICIGGGYISLELGQMFSRFGSQVTIVERGPRLLSRYEPEIGDSVAEVLRNEGIQVLTNARIKHVQGDATQVTVTVEIGGRQRDLKAARLLIATGRRPNTADIGLEKPGVAVDEHGFVKVNEELRTSVDYIYAAGDVIGGFTDSQMATPVGAQDGGIAAGNALDGTTRKVDHRVIPRAIFTDPQVGIVGLTDEEANVEGYACECRTIPMSLVPRAGAVRETQGLIKMVTDRTTHRILGVSMHGLNAAEVIHEAAMGLKFNATIADFAGMLHVYPTMAEALKIVALSFNKDVSRMSCCAE